MARLNCSTLFSPRVWADRLQRWRERIAGVDFSGVVYPSEAGLDPALAQAHVGSGDKRLRAVLRDLDISAADRIIDIGCGKGSAMNVMLEFPFARVDGIEASESIAAVARANFAKLRIAPERCHVMLADAMQFTSVDDYNYIYFYNPFACEVMAAFMKNVVKSVERTPRRLTVVYDNPVCHESILTTGIFRKLDRNYRDRVGNPIRIYMTSEIR
jgi:SAM-dependent methyltransferase